MDSFSKVPKKKRLSEHKPPALSYKISHSLKKNEFLTNEKSNSIGKHKKIRLQTDYAQYDYPSQKADHEFSFNYLKPHSTKKSGDTHQSSQKRKESSSKGQFSHYKLGKDFGLKDYIVKSTKYDSNKNNQVKALFDNPYESKIKTQKKSKQTAHNFSVFLNCDKQKKHPSPIVNILSPYSQQMNSFLKLKSTDKHKRQQRYNDPTSKEKRQSQREIKNELKDRNSKRSVSKGFRQNSTPKHLDLHLMNKNNIRLKTSMGTQQVPENKKKQSKILKFFSKNTKDHQKKEKQYNNQFIEAANKEDQQSTVKTIKKPQSFNNKQSSLRQLESSRVTSEDSQNSEDYGLTQEEIQTFGDRFPYGFQKMKLLGRGGFSLVWLGKHNKSGKQFAIKQIITNNTHQTHIKEIWFGTMFFTLGGVPKPEFVGYPGIKNLVRMYSYEINQTDTWIFYEKCGKSLGTSLYDIKSQKIYGEEKLYKIHYKPYYLAMEKNPSILTSIVVQICKSLALVNECQIVHSDLKTQNILIKFNEDDYRLKELKLIDYGSSFQFRNISQFSMATPEYMPPQILNYIIHQNEGQYQEQLFEEVMNNYQNPWAVDMWSLGCVLLQIVVGVPLWMSLPLLVPNKAGKSFLQKEGLFAVKGRLFPEIISKQREVVKRLSWIVEKENYSRIVLSKRMKEVLKGMLQLDFNKRISPSEVISLLSEQL